jgi:hypothetical protein
MELSVEAGEHLLALEPPADGGRNGSGKGSFAVKDPVRPIADIRLGDSLVAAA